MPMVHVSAIFIAVCVVLIGACLGIVSFLTAGLSIAESTLVGLAAMTGLALYHIVSSRASGAAPGKAAELARRLSAMETEGASAGKTRPAADPLMGEIGELGTLVKQLAETVAAHDAKLASGAAAAPATPAVVVPKPSD